MIAALLHKLLRRLRYRRRWALAMTAAREDADRATLSHNRLVAEPPRRALPAAKRRRPF